MRLLMLTFLFTLTLTACGSSDSDSGTPVPTQTPNPTPTPAPTATPTPTPTPIDGETVTISGKVTFDKVPHAYNQFILPDGALDYDATEIAPARGVDVVLLDADNRLLAVTATDPGGNYTLMAPENTAVRVAVDAVMDRNDAYRWHFTVADNTRDGALYSLSGDLLNSGSEDSVRDLHAVSGWSRTIDDYSDITHRPAAPFAILDAIYGAMALLMAADDNFTLPDCTLYWSYRNNTLLGEEESGDIGTTYYWSDSKSIYVLGDADDDTDEYDAAVIQHEFAHFIEDILSRSDSIGGSHDLSSRLDMRLAFSEGFANAFAGMAGGTGIYSDSGGVGQSSGYSVNLEDNHYPNPGWFSENSVGKLLYDIYDSANDGFDTLSLGFGPIYDTLTSDDFVQSGLLTNIHLFNGLFSAALTSDVRADYRAMLISEQIYGEDIFGTGELNDGGSSDALPVYHSLNDGAATVCSSNAGGERNRLGVNTFLHFEQAVAATRSLVISRISSTGSSTDPDAYLYRNGELVDSFISEVVNSETASGLLQPGDYTLEVADYFNIDEDPATGGRSCFSVILN